MKVPLTKLRELCGQAHDSPCIWQQIGPSRSRKVYRRDRYFTLRANQFKFRNELLWQLRSRREIERRIDRRPLLQLREELDTVISQIVLRAATGHEHAIKLLYSHVKHLIKTFEAIEKDNRLEKLRAIAERCADWPVLLSLNPQVIKHEKERLRLLRVGSKAGAPRLAGQKTDPRSFWSDLADTAFQSCQNIGIVLPELRKHCRGVKRQRKSYQLWGLTINVNVYNQRPDVIVIAEWEEECAKLSLPVTNDNFQLWWKAVRYHVLEYWRNAPDEYHKALNLSVARSERQTGHDEEWRRRNRATGRLEKAFRDLFGLRKKLARLRTH